MTPLPEHEDNKEIVEDLVKALLEELDIEFRSLGSTTFKSSMGKDTVQECVDSVNLSSYFSGFGSYQVKSTRYLTFTSSSESRDDPPVLTSILFIKSKISGEI